MRKNAKSGKARFQLGLILLYLISVTANASDFSTIILSDTKAQKHVLSDYIGHGKWVLVNIWGTDCPPCRDEMPELVRFHDQHQDTDAMVVGIAIDFPSYGYADRDEVIAFADDYLIDFPILLSDARITERMRLGRLQGLPTTFLFSPDGDVAAMQVGAITQEIVERFIKQKTPSLKPTRER